MDRETLSIMKACEVVGVSRRTIYNWISAGKVEYVRTAGGSIRIFADTLWRPSTSAQLGVSRVEGRAAAPDERPGHSSRTPAGPHA
jgi:excisionase family DNA binding protein